MRCMHAQWYTRRRIGCSEVLMDMVWHQRLFFFRGQTITITISHETGQGREPGGGKETTPECPTNSRKSRTVMCTSRLGTDGSGPNPKLRASGCTTLSQHTLLRRQAKHAQSVHRVFAEAGLGSCVAVGREVPGSGHNTLTISHSPLYLEKAGQSMIRHGYGSGYG